MEPNAADEDAEWEASLADHANERFKGPSAFDAGPMWCFDRVGMSRTQLPDGRVVHIGGEHEDHYDPDFCIYNVRVDGLTVRFVEDGFSVRAVVEGRLAADRLAALQRRTLQLLERVDAGRWEIEE